MAIQFTGWLHRGCKPGAREVCVHGVSKGAILYVTTRISAVFGEGADPICVFDGNRSYPAKAAEQAKRAKTREAAQCTCH